MLQCGQRFRRVRRSNLRRCSPVKTPITALSKSTCPFYMQRFRSIPLICLVMNFCAVSGAIPMHFHRGPCVHCDPSLLLRRAALHWTVIPPSTCSSEGFPGGYDGVRRSTQVRLHDLVTGGGGCRWECSFMTAEGPRAVD